MNRDDLCGGPSLTPPGYYDLPEAEEEQCHQCENWVEVEKLTGGLCRECCAPPTCEECGADLHGEIARLREMCHLCFATRELEDEEYDPGDSTELPH